MTFLIITLCCAFSCLCVVEFRQLEVKRIDSEIGVNKYINEEEVSGLVVGAAKKDEAPKGGVKDEQPAARSGSAAGSRAGSDQGGSPRGS